MTIFDIGNSHPNSPHLFADLAELLLLVGYYGRPYLHANDLESLLDPINTSLDEIDEEDEEDQAERSSAERNSRHDAQIEEVMSHLSYRSGAFHSWYPFELDGEQIKVAADLTEEQRLYRLLLACSRLRSFGSRGLPQRWAKVFVCVSREAMSGLMPAVATTRIFDANSDDRHDYFGTNLRDALKKLGEDLGVIHVNNAQCDSSSTSGDGGFDLISNLHFNDGAATAYAILGQCGAQEIEWPSKKLEAHSINIRNYFQVLFDYPSVMFTPVCYRIGTGEWVNNSAANGVLLLDRLRILFLIGSQDLTNHIVNSPWFRRFETEFLEFIVAANN